MTHGNHYCHSCKSTQRHILVKVQGRVKRVYCPHCGHHKEVRRCHSR
jgi:predicted RNA-binding Zn-ribbon protein involved in translation (DUF1610 family)